MRNDQDNGVTIYEQKNAKGAKTPIVIQEPQGEPKTQTVIVVEGEPTRAAAASAGYRAATWRSGAQQAHKADWTPLLGERVILWPDDDLAGRSAMNVVGRVLNDLGIAYMDIVPTSGKSKDDAADMSPRDFATILDTAHPWEPMPSENWHRLAHVFQETSGIVEYARQPYVCESDRWRRISNADAKSQIARVAKTLRYIPKPRDVGDALEYLLNQQRIPAEIEAPLMLPGYEPLTADNRYFPGVMAFKNGWVNSADPLQLHTYQRSQFLPHVLDYDFDPDADIPNAIEDIFEQWFGGDEYDIRRRTFIEMLGYFASGSTALQRCWNLYGLPGTGKSVALRLMSRMFGPGARNIAYDSLAGRFGLAGLVGYALIIMDDCKSDSLPRREAARWSENMLGIVGDRETFEVEPKHVSAYEAKIRGRVAIASNPPIVNPANPEGWYRRILYLPFENPIMLGDQDPAIQDTLWDAIPAILAEALRAWSDCVKKSPIPHIAEPLSSVKLRDELLETRDDISTWFGEYVKFQKDSKILSSKLYKSFSEAQNGRPSEKSQGFGKKLAAMLRHDRRVIGPERTHGPKYNQSGYSGLALKAIAEDLGY